eukprot:GGOE01029838.1.p2 GENE.GGOE01029838.1~~GGOE01029838.1.p2  ORF type:complete len:105 (+),score=5.15 GGOE01029838.1:297-611(+)
MNRGTHARGAAGSQRQRKGRREEKKKQQRGTTSHQRGKAVGQNRVGNCVLDRGKVVLAPQGSVHRSRMTTRRLPMSKVRDKPPHWNASYAFVCSLDVCGASEQI